MRAEISSLSMKEWNALHERDKFSDYLPYFLYDDERGLYLTNQNSYGAILQVLPRQIAGAQTAEMMEELLSKMPPEMIVQILLFGSKNDEGMIEEWKNIHGIRAKNEPNQERRELLFSAVENMSHFYRSKFHESITNQMNSTLKNMRVFFAFTHDDPLVAKEFKKILFNILQGNRFDPKEVSPTHLKGIVYEMINGGSHPVNEEEIPALDPYRELNKQMVCPDTTIRFTDDYCEVDRRYWIALTPYSYPEYAILNDMGLKIGDYLSNAMNTNQFKDSFMLSLAYYRQGKKRTDRVKRNHSIILTQKWSEILFRRFNAVRRESVSILDRIDVKRESLYLVDMNLLISGKSLQEAEKNVATIKSYWNKGGRASSIVLAEARGVQQLCFVAAMPMAINREFFEVTDRGRSMFGQQAAQFAPLEADWKGNASPNLILFSRRAQIAGFDMFISNNNFNGYVIAESGSGKSVFLNMIAFCSYLRGDRVFIQDFGGSFKKLCEMVGGQYIEPDRQKPFSLNPFSEIQSEEHLRDELDFLSMFIYGLGANKHKEQYEKDEKLFKSHIQEIIQQLYDELGNSLEVSDIRDQLLAKARGDKGISDYCQQLGMYCRGGIYEEFFTGPCKVDFSNPFIVAEIQQIEKDDDIRDPIIMMLTYHQANVIYRDNRPGQRIVNIYDEAHKYIGKDPRMDDFIEQNYRRGRKHGASSIIATQGFDDIYDAATGKLSRAGKAIVNSSSWKFFLKQSEPSINMLLSAGTFSFDEISESLLRSTKTVKGEYSEIFIITPEEGKFVYRLVMDRFFYYITTTDSMDKKRIETKMASGLSLARAIEALMREDQKNKGVI